MPARTKRSAKPARKQGTRARPSARAGQSKTTTDHAKIQQWATARRGHPATVKSTDRRGEAGVLRIDFPGYRGTKSLEEISWDEFFRKFDEKQLTFLYQEKTASGRPSRFFKLISRESAGSKGRR